MTENQEKQKSFFPRWKDGMKKAMQDPEDLLIIRIWGYWGSLIGTSAAIAILIYYGWWYICLAIGFSLVITLTQLFEEKLKLKALRIAKKQTQEFQQLFETGAEEKSNLEAIG